MDKDKDLIYTGILLVVCVLIIVMLWSYFAGYRQAQTEIPTIGNIEEVLNRYDARISALANKINDLTTLIEEGDLK